MVGHFPGCGRQGDRPWATVCHRFAVKTLPWWRTRKLLALADVTS